MEKSIHYLLGFLTVLCISCVIAMLLLAYDNKLNDTQERVSLLSAQVSADNITIEQYEDTIEEYIALVELEQADKQDIQEQKTAVEIQLADKVTLLEQAQSQLAGSEGYNTELQATIVTLQSDISILQGVIIGYEGEILTKNTTINTLNNNITTLQNAVTTLQAMVTSVKAELWQYATIAPIDSQEYTGSEITPIVTVSAGSFTFIEGVDYSVFYSNNVNTGQASVSVIGVGDNAFEYTSNYNIYNILPYNCSIISGTNTVVLTAYTGSYVNVVIPDTISFDINNNVITGSDYTIVQISNSVFKDKTEIQSLTMSNNINYLGESVFLRCSSLSSLVLSSNIIVIGKSAICRTAITSFTFPSGVQYIRQNVLAYCPNLTTIILPSALIQIDTSPFQGCPLLTTVDFSNCINSSITVSGSSTTGYTFASCYALSSITLSDSIKYLPCSAFLDCNNLTSVTLLSTTVVNIDSKCFYGITTLPTIYVPASLLSTYQSTYSNYNFVALS